jgi:hypothetical protein
LGPSISPFSNPMVDKLQRAKNDVGAITKEKPPQTKINE